MFFPLFKCGEVASFIQLKRPTLKLYKVKIKVSAFLRMFLFLFHFTRRAYQNSFGGYC